ncbi:carboxylesterase family protein, partial [Lutimaribacter sp. EGI FJ00014]|nr:carboxylesterase family protein [Lutimaribacter sp. EGI FJ00014]
MMAMIGATFMPTVGTQASEYVTAADRALVATDAGKLLGAERNDVLQYLGVQYATAERFMTPQKVKSWEGVRPAVTYGNNCPIPPMSEVANDELFNPHRYLPMSEN